MRKKPRTSTEQEIGGSRRPEGWFHTLSNAYRHVVPELLHGSLDALGSSLGMLSVCNVLRGRERRSEALPGEIPGALR